MNSSKAVNINVTVYEIETGLEPDKSIIIRTGGQYLHLLEKKLW